MSGAASDLPPAAGRRPRRRAREVLESALYGTALYRISLRGQRPEALVFGPTNPWPGSSTRGRAMLAGSYRFGGQTITAPQGFPWRAEGADPAWLAEAHGFAWLSDLDAVGGAEARGAARDAVARWIAAHGGWQALAWRPDVLARRLVAWLSHATLLLAESDREAADAVLASLAEQSRHLARAATGGSAGEGRIVAIKGLIFAALCLPGDDRRLADGVALLEAEIARQVLADGGHVARSPAVQFSVFRDLVELRGLFAATRQPAPAALQGALDRMAPMLRALRHGDGGLALFNGANEGEAAVIDIALSLGEAPGRPLISAPHVGFERVVAHHTVLIVDVGSPGGLAEPHAHAGLLSFEMSIDKTRVVVNCGAFVGGNPAWQTAQRATAAHSTVGIGDTNSIEIRDDGGIGRRPGRVTCQRHEDGGSVWLDASHDGYQAPFGVTHRRRLYLAADGDNLRGEDSLSGRGGEDFAVRFHLHPDVTVSLVGGGGGGGGGALLRLPGGIGWRMRASGAAMSIAESIYLGRPGEPSRSEQIVLTGPIKGGVTTIKWALTRLEGSA